MNIKLNGKSRFNAVRLVISFQFLAGVFFAYAAFNAVVEAQTLTSAGTALNFNNDNYASVNLASPPANNYTISAWVFLRTGGVLNNPRMAVLSSSVCDSSVELLIRSATGSATDPQFLELGRCTGFNGFASTTAIPLNTWTHVAATLSANKTVSYYINGVPAGTFVDSNSAHNYALGGAVNLGDNSFRKFNGMIDQVEIWNRVLSPLEIMIYRDLKLAGNENGLYAYYRFDEGSGTTAANSATGSASAATLVNNPGWTNSSVTLYQFLPLTNSLATSNMVEGPSAGFDSIMMAVSPLTLNWTNTNNVPWLHLDTTNSIGSGSTNIIFSFDQNTGGTRTGTLSIAGQTLTVTQAGATYAPILLLDNSSGNFYSPVAALVPSVTNCEGVTVDGAGNVYFPDATHNVMRKWTAASNSVTTLISSGLNLPLSVVADGAGNLYIGNASASGIQRWDAMTQTLTPVLTGTLSVPQSLALDGAGNLYIADFGLNSIFKWSPWNNTVTTVVSGLSQPSAVYVDVASNLYYADAFHIRLRSAANGATTVLVNHSPQMLGMAVDPSGNVYFNDSQGYQFYKWSVLDGGIGDTHLSSGGTYHPFSMLADRAGNVYIADSGTPSQSISPKIEAAIKAYVDCAPPNLPGNGGTVTFGMIPLSPLLSSLLKPVTESFFYSDPIWLTTGVTNGVLNATCAPNLTKSARSDGIFIRYFGGNSTGNLRYAAQFVHHDVHGRLRFAGHCLVESDLAGVDVAGKRQLESRQLDQFLKRNQ